MPSETAAVAQPGITLSNSELATQSSVHMSFWQLVGPVPSSAIIIAALTPCGTAASNNQLRELSSEVQ